VFTLNSGSVPVQLLLNSPFLFLFYSDSKKKNVVIHLEWTKPASNLHAGLPTRQYTRNRKKAKPIFIGSHADERIPVNKWTSKFVGSAIGGPMAGKNHPGGIVVSIHGAGILPFHQLGVGEWGAILADLPEYGKL
jgi:hypothetical protein